MAKSQYHQSKQLPSSKLHLPPSLGSVCRTRRRKSSINRGDYKLPIKRKQTIKHRIWFLLKWGRHIIVCALRFFQEWKHYQCNKKTCYYFWGFDCRILHPSFSNRHALRKMVGCWEYPNEKLNRSSWQRLNFPLFRHFEYSLGREAWMRCWQRCGINRMNIHITFDCQTSSIFQCETLNQQKEQNQKQYLPP